MGPIPGKGADPSCTQLGVILPYGISDPLGTSSPLLVLPP